MYSLNYKLCYRTGTVCIKNCATEHVQSELQTVLQNRYTLHYHLCYITYSLHYKLWYRTGTICITNCATEQVQSALQTVLQNKYILHYKLCYRTVTFCVTNYATVQVQSAVHTTLQNRYSLHYKLCYRTGTVSITSNRYSLLYKLCYRTCTHRITWSLAFWPHSGQGRSVIWAVSWSSCNASPWKSPTPVPTPVEEPHIVTISVWRFRAQNIWFRNSEPELKFFFCRASEPVLWNTQLVPGNKLANSLYLLLSWRRRGAVTPDTHTFASYLN